MVTTITSFLIVVAGLALLPAPPAAAAEPAFACDVVYSVASGDPHTISKINPVSGATSSNGAFDQGSDENVNALALPADGGRYAYGFNRDDNRVLRFDATTENTATYAAPTNSLAPNVVAGAINPANGIYYYAASASGTWTVFAFNTATLTSIGQVATISGSALSTNGDMAFDALGNLYLTTNANSTAAGSLARVTGTVPTTAGSTALGVALLTTTPADSGQYTSIAIDATGLLVIGTSAGKVLRVNAATGATVSTITVGLALADLASCSVPSTGTVRVDLPAGRYAGTDQFTVAITGGGVTSGNTGTTSGTDTGLQNTPAEVGGAVITTRGTTYTVTQTAAGGTNLNDYTTTWSCVKQSDGSVLSSGTGNTGSYAAPASAADVICTFTNTPRFPAIDLTKTAGNLNDPDGNGPDVGDTVVYSYSVTNNGAVPLASVGVVDAKAGTVTCPQTTLAVGASMTCTSKTYVLSQADVDAGQVVAPATATGTSPTGAVVTDTASTTTPVTRTPRIEVDQTASAVVDTNGTGKQDAGDTVTYGHVVTNTGNVTLTGVAVTDPTLGAISCPRTTLAPGESMTCTPKPYVLNQAAVNAGKVDTTATVVGTPPAGAAVNDTDATTVPLTRAPLIDLVLGAGPLGDPDANGVDPGDTIAYSFTVKNTGSVTLDPVTVSDPLLGAITCPTGALAPGATVTCTTRTYAITQADIDAGSVVNNATASGTAPNGAVVTDPDAVTTTLAQNPSVLTTKSASPVADTNGSGTQDAGDRITYTLKVKNTGNTTLTSVAVTDAKLGTVTCPPGALAPGATATCTAPAYPLTQADVDAGRVVNTARGSATSPKGVVVSDEDTVTTTVAAQSAVELDKDAGPIVDVDGNGPDAGDTITYTFEVTNTGAVNLSQVTVADPKVGPVTCPVQSLAPGDSLACSPRTYTLTQGDVDASSVVNTATVRAVAAGGGAVTGSDTHTVVVPRQPDITVDLAAGPVVDLDGNGPDAGDRIDYTVTVTNSGPVALDEVSVSDPRLGPVACPRTTLAPGQSMVCTPVAYTVTAAEASAGSVVNTVTATGTSPEGVRVADDDAATTPVTPAGPATTNLRTDIRVDDPAPRVGDVVTYTITVTNDGPAAAENVVLDDTLPGGVSFASAGAPCTNVGNAVTCALGTLAPGESRVVTITATVEALPTEEAAVQHDIDVQKVEAHVDLDAGQTRTVEVSCAPGYLVTDGAGRIDAVDQGTGTLASVGVLASSATSAGTWSVTMVNDGTGRAQGKVFAVCVKDRTETAGGHSHPLVQSDPVTQTVPLPAGRSEVTLACAPGSVPLVPGHRLDGAAPGTTVPTSYPSAGGWTFVVDAPSGGGTATFTVRCLESQVGPAGQGGGHRHDLDLAEIRQSVIVPAGQVVEHQLTCADNAKGIVAGFDLDAGLVNLGNDPRPKTRVFKLLNPTDAPLEADLYLRCLEVRTAGADVTGIVVNTASATTTTPETSYADNSDSVSFTVDPSAAPAPRPIAMPASAVVTVAGKAVTTTVRCGAGTASCVGTATLVAMRTQKVDGKTVRKGTVLARTTYRVVSGKVGTIRLKSTQAGAKVLRAKAVKKATLKVGSKSRTVTIRR